MQLAGTRLRNVPAYAGLTKHTRSGPQWTGEVRLHPDRLDQPLRWRKPRMIFVNSMSDLFHEGVPSEFILRVYGIMNQARQHTFQVLTKRPQRALEFFHKYGIVPDPMTGRAPSGSEAPPNVWLGVSCEDQQRADERIPLLLRCPAAVRFVSAEPLLSGIDFSPWFDHRVSDGVEDRPWDPSRFWVIIGGESGPGARPCDVAWVRSIVRQCAEAEVACFVKQLGAHHIDAKNGVGGVQAKPDPQLVPRIRRLKHGKGGDPDEWPHDLRVREYPR